MNWFLNFYFKMSPTCSQFMVVNWLPFFLFPFFPFQPLSWRLHTVYSFVILTGGINCHIFSIVSSTGCCSWGSGWFWLWPCQSCNLLNWSVSICYLFFMSFKLGQVALLVLMRMNPRQSLEERQELWSSWKPSMVTRSKPNLVVKKSIK